MTDIDPDASLSIAQLTIDPRECEVRIRDAVSRVFGAKRYHKVGVLTATWDWDGFDLGWPRFGSSQYECDLC